MSDIITYTDKDAEEIWANDLVKAEEVNFEGWLCGIGLESIEIKSNGDIFRGTCRVGGEIGHVDDTVWNLPQDFIICTKTKCTCVADLKSTRYNSFYTREKLKENVKQVIIEKNGNENSNNF